MYIYSHVRRAFPDLYNDKNAQTAHKAPERPTRRGNDQTTIYTTESFIHAYRAFSRLGRVGIKCHIFSKIMKKVSLY